MAVNKVYKLNNLAPVLRDLKAKHKRIVQCHGVFDLLHPGHIRHFAAAKKRGDILVVTVTSDRYVNKGPDRPIFNEQLRAEAVASLTAVDFVAVNDAPTAVPAIYAVRPSFYIKGNEYGKKRAISSGGINKETEAVKKVGGKIEFTDDITFSSTKLINNFLTPYPEATQEFLQGFQKRFSLEDILGYFEKIKNYKVLIIGEAIIDEYHYVRAMNKTPKDIIIAARYEHEEAFAGGSIACANHLTSYCKQVDLLTCLGAKDSKEKFIRAHLKSNVRPQFFYHPTAPTIVKRRFIDSPLLTKMFEVYYFVDSLIPEALEKKILSHLKKVLPMYDLVIVADYGHGLLTPRLIDYLSHNAPFLALNTQTNSANFGFNMATKYPRADFVCIDHLEARLITKKKEVASLDEWKEILAAVTNKLKAKRIIVTLGHEGCLSYDGKKLYKVPVLSTRVLDRVGAGDAFLAITSPLVRAGLPVEAAGFIGNAVGALAVTIVGNKHSVESNTLLKSINTLLKN
ncbi:MAG: adenylyltransferase/cytidyltransferase family protein [Candidatus Liptonbacteria bacterium]|nr:adenylyltransferase/cytidyltransferase family protein [Candidatus Liptonbacteria bacterium]